MRTALVVRLISSKS
ncbi:hypothetical protein Pint_33104 [Pistacia integerrima]|uniref:Uncharacterized protein n=1 Tax=Pistacia integerrima TaxID=434235 RepID=A0ACC0X915_9ROSI|nr:hypothetical protein Pint_33104 [Pistacia integerrima]